MKIYRYLILILFLYSCGNQAEMITSEYIEAVDPGNENLLSEALNSVKEQEIEKVYYGIVNYTNVPDFDGFHLCDQAVLIKLSNGKWLNWVWVEEGFYQTGEINISTSDIQNKLNLDYYINLVDVSESIEWKRFVGRKIDSIQFKTIDINGNNHISDIRLTVGNNHVSICAIEEPDPDKLPKLDGLPYSANWTIIVFDDKILEKYSRIIE